ncbi:MAG TPA: undecaprenyl-diphosphatase UppP [Anaerolineales bacterium]|nr:undecaprenyl-diphosphatase UppP [Anaerolineales bacterium]
MNILHALVLGIIEGLTEFIPVSSTAQMLVGQVLLRIPASDVMTAFLAVVQLGPLVALIVYFWKDLWTLVKAFFARPFSTPENRMAWYVIIASVPALLIGFLLRHAVEALFTKPLLEASIRMFAAAVLMTLAELFGKRARSLDKMNWLDALMVGLFQILAVFPGASRSGSAISGGMLMNFERPAAARFAFLMSTPILLAAGGYETLKVVKMPGLTGLVPGFAIGILVAGVIGWFAIRWLMGYLGKHSLYPFVIYCAVVGAACLVFALI